MLKASSRACYTQLPWTHRHLSYVMDNKLKLTLYSEVKYASEQYQQHWWVNEWMTQTFCSTTSTHMPSEQKSLSLWSCSWCTVTWWVQFNTMSSSVHSLLGDLSAVTGRPAALCIVDIRLIVNTAAAASAAAAERSSGASRSVNEAPDDASTTMNWSSDSSSSRSSSSSSSTSAAAAAFSWASPVDYTHTHTERERQADIHTYIQTDRHVA